MTVSVSVNGDLVEAIQLVSPNSEFSLTGNDLTGLVWLDKVNSRPLDSDILAAVTTVLANRAARKALKQQARLDVKNTLLTPLQRLQALFIVLDLDQ